MTFIDSMFSSDRNRRRYALLKKFKSGNVTSGPGISDEVRSFVAREERELSEDSHTTVPQLVTNDPAALALADQMLAEFQSSPHRRRG